MLCSFPLLLRLLLVLASGCNAAVDASPAPVSVENNPSWQQMPLQETHLREARQRRLHGRFLHITDMHPDKFYRVHSSPKKHVACHRRKGMAGTYGAERTRCDAPFALVNATLDWVEQNLRDEVDFVVWTGDSARHDKDERHPRTKAEVLTANRILADQLADAFSSRGKLSVPIIPNFGNNDFLPHNIMGPGPNEWLRAYREIWKRFIPEEQRHSFEFGGWFYVEVVPSKLAVFSLNTMYFFERNAAVDGCADPSEPGYQHMEWLRVQLQRMRELGMKAILIGHVPPARTVRKQNWDETCWHRYTLWLHRYRDVVVASLFGHMNIDHFLLHDSHQVNLLAGAASEPDLDAPDEEVSTLSKGHYLRDLRKKWGDLPEAVIKASEDGDDDDDDDDDIEDVDSAQRGRKKKKKAKKGKFDNIGGKYAERYHMSLVSPSVVPNYFPTLRVFEYDITGLEDAKVWEDAFSEQAALSSNDPDVGHKGFEEHLDLKRRDVLSEEERGKTSKKGHKGKKGRKNRKHRKTPQGPHLVVPDEPPESSLPGPAYRRQPFTLLGYVQYFANLTHINNDYPDGSYDVTRRRGGKPGKEKPRHEPARPRPFEYEVEYSTFDDKLFQLPDLTVRSYLNLAYRMGERGEGAGSHPMSLDEAEAGGALSPPSDESDDFGAEKRRKKKKGGRKGKKRRSESNKTWLQFLDYAFVRTVPEDELERL